MKGFGLPGAGPDLGGLRARDGGFLLQAETAVSDPVKGFGLPGRQSSQAFLNCSGPDLGVRTSLPGRQSSQTFLNWCGPDLS